MLDSGPRGRSEPAEGGAEALAAAEAALREEARINEALIRIGRAVAAELELEPLVQRLTDEATALTRAQFGAFFFNVSQPTGESYSLFALSGAPREAFAGFAAPRATELFAPTFRGESVVRCDDVTSDARYGKTAPHHGMPPGHLPVKSYLAVPVVSRSGEVIGGLLFGHSAAAMFTERDERLIASVAALASAAVDNARLFHDARRARQGAELAARRVSRLQAVTAALSEALTPSQVAEVAVDHGVAAVGADAGRIYLEVRDGDLELIGQSGVPRPMEGVLAHVLAGSDAPPALVLRDQQPIWIETLAQYESSFPALYREARSHAGASASFCAVPLSTKGRPIGVLSMGFREEHRFADDERAFILTVARQCAQAFDRARLYEAARASNERQRLLAEAGNTLSISLDYETTLDNVARLSMPGLADFGFFDVVEADQTVRRIAHAHEDPELEAVLAATEWARSELEDADVCALSSGRPGFHPHIDDAWLERVASGPEHLELMRRLAFRSMITVPLVIRQKTLGALTLFFGRSKRHHTEADLELAEELARRAASAVENARLFAAAQASQREAEEASRAKDEFLGIVSHELRTPLTAILGWSRVVSAKSNERDTVLRGVEVIERNAKAQVKIIEDILDVSRIITGKLRLDVRAVELGAVLRAALDVLRPTADAKGVALELFCPPEPTIILGDADRLQQIVWNLVSNSLKFTPARGRVTVRLSGGEARASIEVNDTGKGIRPDFLPFVFERFRQADSSSTRAHGGLGLGLAIVRHLVELHGGTVRADSAGSERGATFTLAFPTLNMPRIGERGAMRLTPGPTERIGQPVRVDGVKVLIVDDQRDARDLMGDVLRDNGAVVMAVATADEALLAVASFEPHVILSDIGMPGEDGFALIRRVRSLEGPIARVPAVAVTAYARAEDARKMLLAGFQMHVSKPVEPATLTAVVANLGGRVGIE